MNMCQSNKRKLPSESCLKGQIFFIASNVQCLESVNNKIVALGGKVDPFFSKQITTVLIEDNYFPRPQLLPQDINGTRAGFNAHLPRHHYQPVTEAIANVSASTSRGYTLLSSSLATQSHHINDSVHRVIEAAKQWGIQVLGISMFLEWVNTEIGPVVPPKKRKFNEKLTHLSGFFIKVESDCKKYKPCYKMFNNDSKRLMPLQNTNNLKKFFKPDICNIVLENPVGDRHLHFSYFDSKNKIERKGCDSKLKHLKIKTECKSPVVVKSKAQTHFCECCRLHFTDFKQHIKSAKHQSFIRDEKNYESVNKILKMLPSAQEFIEKHKNPTESTTDVLKNGEHSNSACNVEISDSNSSNALPSHLKRKIDEIKQEPQEFLEEIENVESVNVIEISPVPPKQETHNDCNLPIISSKVYESSCVPDASVVVSNENTLNDPLFDKTNSSALAQLCLKNFDSYWLDTLPCEMDDIVFDDCFFDFDDTKPKLPAEDQTNDNIGTCFQSSSNVVQSAIVSDVTTMFNKPTVGNIQIDVKNIVKSETGPVFSDYNRKEELKLEIDKNVSKMRKEPFISESVESKKLKISLSNIAKPNLYARKSNIESTPCCSNMLPGKLEQMFSSESSDDENGNVLISNVLNIITNSDSDMRVDKDLTEAKTATISDMDSKPNVTSVVVTDKPSKKPKIQKMKRLPPLWSVSIVPGNGVRLKFTCIHSDSTSRITVDPESTDNNNPQSSDESEGL